jgi:hypothetical protein
MEFIEIENIDFLICSQDHPDCEMNWNKAIQKVIDIGSDCRLPNNDELLVIYQNKDKIPNLDNFDAYWSSENNDDPNTVHGKQGQAFSLTLYSGILTKLGKSRYRCLVRLVKDKS